MNSLQKIPDFHAEYQKNEKLFRELPANQRIKTYQQLADFLTQWKNNPKQNIILIHRTGTGITSICRKMFENPPPSRYIAGYFTKFGLLKYLSEGPLVIDNYSGNGPKQKHALFSPDIQQRNKFLIIDYAQSFVKDKITQSYMLSTKTNIIVFDPDFEEMIAYAKPWVNPKIWTLTVQQVLQNPAEKEHFNLVRFIHSPLADKSLPHNSS